MKLNTDLNLERYHAQYFQMSMNALNDLLKYQNYSPESQRGRS